MNKNLVYTETSLLSQLSNLYCGYSATHNQCSQLYLNIKENINVFSNYNTLLTNFINSLKKNYHNGGVCVSIYTCTDLFEILLNLADIESLDNITFENMCLNLKFTDMLIPHITKMKRISAELIAKIICSRNKIIIEKILFNNDLELNFSSSHIELICSNNNSYFIKSNVPIHHGGNNKINPILVEDSSKKDSKIFSDKLINELINRKIKVTKTAIIFAIIYNINLPTIKTLLSIGPTLCEEYLIAACYSLNKEIIDFLLDNKIEPTSKCIKALFKPNINDDELFKKELFGLDKYILILNSYHKDIPHSPVHFAVINKYTTILETLLNYNYKLTYEDVINATRYYIKIDNITNYDIKFDSKFLEVCYEVGFYPKYNHNIKPDITCLQKECDKYGNMTNIKKLIIIDQLKPDAICMQNACKFKSNLQIIKFLHEKGAPIDHYALKNIIRANGNTCLIFLIDEYIKTIEEKKEVIKEVIKEVPKVEENKEVIKEVPKVEDKKKVIKEVGNKIKNTQKAVQEVNLSSDSEEEEAIVKPTKTKKIIIKKTKKNESEEDKKNKNNDPIKVNKVNKEVKFDDYKLVKTKITNKDEISLSENFLTFYNIEKNIKLKVLSFKKILFKYFNDNKLIKKDSFDIDLSSELCKAIGFDNIKYGNKINLKDIDAFCLYILDINNKSCDKSLEITI